MKKLKQIGVNAKKAVSVLNNLDSKKINKVLSKYNQLLLKNKKQILRENTKDVKSVRNRTIFAGNSNFAILGTFCPKCV